MARPPKRRTPRRKTLAVNTLAMPTVLFGCLFAIVADNTAAAAVVGALLGFVIGLGILAFPDLDRGGPADHDDFLH
ncbi:MAG: hypothetical protein ABL973_05890 [Micropepsaceae bacterium]